MVSEINCFVGISIEIKKLRLEPDVLMVFPAAFPQHECARWCSDSVILGKCRTIGVRRLTSKVQQGAPVQAWIGEAKSGKKGGREINQVDRRVAGVPARHVGSGHDQGHLRALAVEVALAPMIALSERLS